MSSCDKEKWDDVKWSNVPLKVHLPITVQIRRVLTLRLVSTIVISTILTCVASFTIIHHGDFQDREGLPVATWKPLLVWNFLVVHAILELEGARPEATMLGLASLAVLCNCLNEESLYAAVSFDGITTLALLFPIVKALHETGWPTSIVGEILGSPNSTISASARMFAGASIISSLFNLIPVGPTLVPMISTWCQRLNFELRSFLLPLSFAVRSGSTVTFIGSSTTLVAREVFARSTNGRFVVGLFHLSLGGSLLALFVGLYCILIAPALFKSSCPPLAGASTPERDATTMRKKLLYKVQMVVLSNGVLVGQSLEASGLHRIAGVISVRLSQNSSTPCSIELAQWTERKVSVSAESHDPAPRSGALSSESISSPTIASDSVLLVTATAEGIANLRRVRGLELGNEQKEISMLGAGRRRRRLMEAVVGPGLSNKPVNVLEVRHELRCAVVGVRSSNVTGWQSSCEGLVLNEGDTLLIEAFMDAMGCDAWAEHFGVVCPVPDSTPERVGRLPDMLRAFSVAIGLAMVTSIAIFGDRSLDLHVLGVLLNCFLIFVKSMDMKTAYRSLDAGLLLTIIGSFALGSSMQEVGLARYLSRIFIRLGSHLGSSVVLLGFYVLAAGLSHLIDSTLVLVALGEIGTHVSDGLDIPISTIAFVIVYASSACWIWPVRSQTSQMVMKVGGYTRWDLMKFGAPLQVLHMFATVAVALICSRLS